MLRVGDEIIEINEQNIVSRLNQQHSVYVISSGGMETTSGLGVHKVLRHQPAIYTEAFCLLLPLI